MKPNMSHIMKQAKQMQEKMQAEQERIANLEITGESGAGMVKITMNGRHDAKKVEIDANAIDGLSADDKEMLEDLICAAINDASRKIDENSNNSMSNLAGGMNIPGLDGLFK